MWKNPRRSHEPDVALEERALKSATLMDRYWAHVDRVSLRVYGKRFEEADGSV